MTGRDSLDLEILSGVAGEFEYFGGEVFEDGSDVDGGWEDGRSVGWWRVTGTLSHGRGECEGMYGGGM